MSLVQLLLTTAEPPTTLFDTEWEFVIVSCYNVMSLFVLKIH